MTPIRTPLQLNPGREQILICLADSEADTIRIAKKLSIVKDILAKAKYVRISTSSLKNSDSYHQQNVLTIGTESFFVTYRKSMRRRLPVFL